MQGSHSSRLARGGNGWRGCPGESPQVPAARGAAYVVTAENTLSIVADTQRDTRVGRTSRRPWPIGNEVKIAAKCDACGRRLAILLGDSDGLRIVVAPEPGFAPEPTAYLPKLTRGAWPPGA